MLRLPRITNWRRFSLRTLFVLMTLCCLAVGTWSAIVNPYRMQQQSLAKIQLAKANYGETTPNKPAWHRWLVTAFLDKKAYRHVTSVDLSHSAITDDDLRALSGLVFLEKLNLDYTQITDKGAAAIPSLRSLRELSLRYTQVGDNAAKHLVTTPSLTVLYLTGTPITDAAIPTLAKNQNLAELFIRWTKITNVGATKLATAMPHCIISHYERAAE
jgi:hypothetical protein